MKKNYLFTGITLFGMGFTAMAQPTQPGTPLTCNTNSCTAPTSENCGIGSAIVAAFTGAQLRNGSPTSLPATYSYYNIANVAGNQINALVIIDAASNVNMSGSNFAIDDDAALDQNNNSMAAFFAPRITASGNFGTSDQRGYVQFTIKFFVENGTAGQQYPGDYQTVPPSGGLTGLNYIHYDIDGFTQGTGGWFRETGVVQNVAGSVINGDASTELSAYSYVDGVNWKGFAGSVCERSGVSRCAQVTAAASYITPQTQITFRMGYDYNYTTSQAGAPTTRQYGSRFGCFSFPQQSTLPVSLRSFQASRTMQSATVNVKWTTTTEMNNRGFEVQRNTGNDNWETVAFINSQAPGGNSVSEINYFYNDLNPVKTVTQYRLRQIDIDSKIKYSEIRSVRGLDQKDGMIVYPNPAVDGKINIVFDDKNVVRDLSLMDMSGRTVKQINHIAAGSIQLENMVPGMYTLRVFVPATGQQAIEKVIITNH